MEIGYFYYGLLKYKEAKEKYNLSNKDSENVKDFDDKILELQLIEPYLDSAIFYFNESIKICKSENMNRIKVIVMIIYVAECHFLKQEYNEGAIKIRDAMIEFGNFNIDFFDKEKNQNKLLTNLDPRIMIFINSVLLEKILYNLSMITSELQKKKLSAWIMNKLIDNTFYLNRKIQSNVLERLKNIIFSDSKMDVPLENLENNPNYTNISKKEIHFYQKSKSLVNRIFNRLSTTDEIAKNICILTTENLLKQFPCPIDLKNLLIKYLKSYFKENDLISFMQLNERERNYFKNINIKRIDDFKERADLFEYDKNWDHEINNKNFKIDFVGGLKEIIEEFKNENNNNMDNIIFCFINSDDFDLDSEADLIFDDLVINNVSLYFFYFDHLDEKKIKKIKMFLKNLDEGHLIIVKNYEIIERAFQNISFSKSKKNVVNLKFANHNYIL